MSILPHKVIYIDVISSWYPDPTVDFRQAADAGYNVIILAFYLTTGPADAVNAWAVAATEAQRQATSDYIHNKGAVLLMSVGGATELPYKTMTGLQYGDASGKFAKQYGFDGVDYDLEGFGPGLTFDTMDSETVINWLVDCTSACRTALGPNKYISHAPQGPYFGPIGDTTTWAGVLGGYTSVNNKADIDFYNVQYYNQGVECYSTYDGLFNGSCFNFPKTSVMNIANAGVPLNKLVVGKPLLLSDASNGYVDPVTLGQWFIQAKTELSWNAGVMAWQWQGQSTSQAWLNNVYPPSATTVVINNDYEEIYGYRCHKHYCT